MLRPWLFSFYFSLLFHSHILMRFYSCSPNPFYKLLWCWWLLYCAWWISEGIDTEKIVFTDMSCSQHKTYWNPFSRDWTNIPWKPGKASMLPSCTMEALLSRSEGRGCSQAAFCFWMYIPLYYRSGIYAKAE